MPSHNTKELVFPQCGARFYAPSAEELAFNSQGACVKCGGTSIIRTVDLDTLVPDGSLTIDGGAVALRNSLTWSLMTDICPDCRGTRLSAAARASKLRGISLDEACAMTLSQLVTWVQGVPASLPEEMRSMAESICEVFDGTAKRLMDLGPGYLTLGEETPSLSGGEAQRLKLASEIGRTQEDSIFVFGEPSIGLHPLDVRVLLGVFQALLGNGATVVGRAQPIQVLSGVEAAAVAPLFAYPHG